MTEQLEDRRLLTLVTTDQTAFVGAPNPAVSQGAKTHLVIRADLQDAVSNNFTDAQIRTAMSTVNDYFVRETFGLASFPDALLTIVPGHVVMPYTKAQIEVATTAGAPPDANSAMHDSAKAAAVAFGFTLADYKHITVIVPDVGGRVGWAGLASVGAGGKVWMNNTIDHDVWTQELQHNLGASHSAFMFPNDVYSQISDSEDAQHEEYGSIIDVNGLGPIDVSDMKGASRRGR